MGVPFEYLYSYLSKLLHINEFYEFNDRAQIFGGCSQIMQMWVFVSCKKYYVSVGKFISRSKFWWMKIIFRDI